MEDELALYLSQRAELITSDDADLGQLRKQDRRLLSAMDRGALDSPLAQRDGADEALLKALETDPEQNALWLEARDSIWPGELGRVQHLVIARAGIAKRDSTDAQTRTPVQGEPRTHLLVLPGPAHG